MAKIFKENNSIFVQDFVNDLIQSIVGEKLAKTERSYEQILFPNKTTMSSMQMIESLNHLIPREKHLDGKTIITLRPFVAEIRMTI